MNALHSSTSEPTHASIIHLKKLNLRLQGNAGPVHILHDIDLNVNPQERLAIVGPSGSGKTSMLMIIAGLERPSSGHVIINGAEITHFNEDQLAAFRARNIGIVFQSFYLIPTMTALENVAIPLEFLRDENAREKAQEALSALKLSHRLHHYPSQLSGGEQQRVGIARAFVTQPRLLLADEPTGNLDHDTGEQVIRLLFEQQEKYGTTLMLITHDSSLAARCGRIIHINDGRIVAHA